MFFSFINYLLKSLEFLVIRVDCFLDFLFFDRYSLVLLFICISDVFLLDIDDIIY